MLMQRVGLLLLALVGLVGAGAGLLLDDARPDSDRQANGAAPASKERRTHPAGTGTKGASIMDTDSAGLWLDDAEALMADRRFAEATALLSARVDRTPNNW